MGKHVAEKRRRPRVPLFAALGVGAVLSLGAALPGLLRPGAADAAPEAVRPPSLPVAAPSPTPSPTRPAASASPSVAASPVLTVVDGVTCQVPAGAPAAASTALVTRLQAALAESTDDSDDVSAAVLDLTTGSACAVHGTTSRVSARIVKVTTVAALLWQREDQGRSLTASERRLAEDAITISDNDAERRLWVLAGGDAGMQRFMDAVGMDRSRTTGNWGLTSVTASDELALLRMLARGPVLGEASREYLLGLMRSVSSDQRWGVPKAAPGDAVVAVKNGWLPQSNGRWRINSIGYVSGGGAQFCLAVLTQDQASMGSGIARVEKVARAVGGAFAR